MALGLAVARFPGLVSAREARARDRGCAPAEGRGEPRPRGSARRLEPGLGSSTSRVCFFFPLFSLEPRLGGLELVRCLRVYL